MKETYDGLGCSMQNLSRISNAVTRSLSAENFRGEKGAGGMALEGTGKNAARGLGQKWKVSPSVVIKPSETFVIADIAGPGAINHIWMTPTGNWRFSILRIYWDGSENPSVECPVGDFFACPLQTEDYSPLSSLAVCVNPKSAFNCYWEMPFRRSCRITMENIADDEMVLYYQIDYILTEVPEDRAYFHAQFRRVNPLPYKEDYTILDNVSGEGQYVGTHIFWGSNNNAWWGEGEVKFFIDGDGEFPTVCGTGAEDYFCGSYDFNVQDGYREFTTPYSGLAKVIRPDGHYRSQMRFSLYRWHITDPLRFKSDLRVTIQALGWRPDGRYLPLRDDISSVAFWYQTLPFNKFPPLPENDALEII